jgi:hypothetical protein
MASSVRERERPLPMTKPKTKSTPTMSRRDPRPIEAIGTEYDSLVPDTLVTVELGVSTMTVWRWDNEDADADAVAPLGWPPPIVFRRRKFRSRQALEIFKKNLTDRAIKERGRKRGAS